MLIKTKIAFAAVALLSLAGASAASAGDNSSGDYHGGFVMSGSMEGVNPAYHPDVFRGPVNSSGHANARNAFASTTRSKADRAQGQNAFGLAGGAAGYNGTFINGNFIPRGTSPAQVPAYREEY